MYGRIFPSRSTPLLAHSGGCVGLVGVDVVGKIGYKRKGDQRDVSRHLHRGM